MKPDVGVGTILPNDGRRVVEIRRNCVVVECSDGVRSEVHFDYIEWCIENSKG